MRRFIFAISAAVLVVGYTGCAKDKACGRRYAPAYYPGAPCGCDGAAAPFDGFVGPGPGPVAVSAPLVGPVAGPSGQTITSTPIHAGAGY